MTRIDYCDLAFTIRAMKKGANKTRFINQLCRTLKATFLNFNETKFKKACAND